MFSCIFGSWRTIFLFVVLLALRSAFWFRSLGAFVTSLLCSHGLWRLFVSKCFRTFSWKKHYFARCLEIKIMCYLLWLSHRLYTKDKSWGLSLVRWFLCMWRHVWLRRKKRGEGREGWWEIGGGEGGKINIHTFITFNIFYLARSTNMMLLRTDWNICGGPIQHEINYTTRRAWSSIDFNFYS